MADLIIKGGALFRWPASVGSFKSVLRGAGISASIPSNPQLPLTIGEYTLLTPESTARPVDDVVREVAPILVNDEWGQQWFSRAFSQAEIGYRAAEDWKTAMEATDKDMPRYIEDILDKIGTAGLPQEMIDRYNSKKILRGNKPT